MGGWTVLLQRYAQALIVGRSDVSEIRMISQEIVCVARNDCAAWRRLTKLFRVDVQFGVSNFLVQIRLGGLCVANDMKRCAGHAVSDAHMTDISPEEGVVSMTLRVGQKARCPERFAAADCRALAGARLVRSNVCHVVHQVKIITGTGLCWQIRLMPWFTEKDQKSVPIIPS